MADKVHGNTKYREVFNEQAHKLCLLGATNAQLADFFDVNEETIYRWQNEYTDFLDAVKSGKIVADAEIAYSLFHRAKGYSHPDTKMFLDRDEEGNSTILTKEYTKHYPPDGQSGRWWLNNRRPKDWKDKQTLELETPEKPKLVSEGIQAKLDEILEPDPSE